MDEVTRIAHGVLVKGREILTDPKNWLKGDMTGLREDGHGMRFCSLGVLHEAALSTRSGAASAVFNRLDDILLACLDRRWMGKVAAFNDHPGTSHADVLAFFDKCIRHAENMEPKVVTPVTQELLPKMFSVPITWMPFGSEKPVTEVKVEQEGVFIKAITFETPVSLELSIPEFENAKAFAEASGPVKELVPA